VNTLHIKNTAKDILFFLLTKLTNDPLVKGIKLDDTAYQIRFSIADDKGQEQF
jgi:hypothetical protein